MVLKMMEVRTPLFTTPLKACYAHCTLVRMLLERYPVLLLPARRRLNCGQSWRNQNHLQCASSETMSSTKIARGSVSKMASLAETAFNPDRTG
jgi:hypothetical protein